ncbi:hypothetical protein PEC311524_02660 [Pectobacterium carotovorum subsp. carotovorum]|nr:hypothetical protein PEC311524_02660 [Pectobacterium carotovorum subsp. carotovorum]
MIKEKPSKQLTITSLLPTNNAYLNNKAIIRSCIEYLHDSESDVHR